MNRPTPTTRAATNWRLEDTLQKVGAKLDPGGAHISRTMMLSELEQLLAAVALGSPAAAYEAAILQQNVLGKATGSTRSKSLRHLRELYGLSESIPLFAALRRLYAADPQSLPLLALLCAWCRDPLLRATTGAILPLSEGARADTSTLANAIGESFPGQYSDLNQNKIARNAASSWTQSGHLQGRTAKLRHLVRPSAAAITMALWLGRLAGTYGPASFANPFCRLLDLDPNQARTLAAEAHRHSLLTLRSIGEVVELSFQGLPTVKGSGDECH